MRDESVTIQTMWQDINQTTIKASEKTIPEMQNGEANSSFGEECSDTTKKKNEAYKIMIQKRYTRVAEERYKEIRREIKRKSKNI